MRQDNTIERQEPSSIGDNRLTLAYLLQDYALRPTDQSQRDFARQNPISRGALRRALHPFEADPDPLDPFFTAPEGLIWLRRLLFAAHLVFSLMGNCGLRLLALFIELAGLDRYIANSLGSHHHYSHLLQDRLIEADKHLQAQICHTEPLNIDVCVDENFHHKTPVLVALEPNSGYVLLCQHADKRDLRTWSERLSPQLERLRLSPRQVVSDAARALIALADEFGVPWSEDLFHVHNHISKALALKVFAAHNKTGGRLEAAVAEAGEAQAQLLSSTSKSLSMLEKVDKSRQKVAELTQEVTQGQRACQWLSGLHEQLSASDHPLCPATGQIRSEADLDLAHEDWLARLTSGLGEHLSAARAKTLTKTLKQCLENIKGRQKVFRERVEVVLEGVEERLRQVVVEGALGSVLFGRYAKTEDEEHWASRALERAQMRWQEATKRMDEDVIEELEDKAEELSNSWQRSTSRLEGFNGLLSLRHENKGRLSSKRLDVVRCLHNNFIKDNKGLTAFERLFGVTPPDLFQAVLERLPLPPAPRKRRLNV